MWWLFVCVVGRNADGSYHSFDITPDVAIKRYKSHGNGNRVTTGLSERDAFFVEAARLLHIERHKIFCGRCAVHLPTVVRVDVVNRTIWQENRGVTLATDDGARQLRAVTNLTAQLDCISTCLTRMRMTHCDIKPNNFVIRGGTVTIIDFDAVIGPDVDQQKPSHRNPTIECYSNVSHAIWGRSAPFHAQWRAALG